MAVKLSTILLAFLIFSGVVLSFMSGLTSMSDSYGVEVENSTWQDTFDSVKNITEIVGAQTEVVQTTAVDSTVEDPDFKISSVFNLALNLPKFVGSMITSFFSNVAKGNNLWNAIFITAFGIIILFAVVSAKRRYDT